MNFVCCCSFQLEKSLWRRKISILTCLIKAIRNQINSLDLHLSTVSSECCSFFLFPISRKLSALDWRLQLDIFRKYLLHSDEHMKHLYLMLLFTLFFFRPSWSYASSTARFWSRSRVRAGGNHSYYGETKATNPSLFAPQATVGPFARKLMSFALCCYVISLVHRPQPNFKHNGNEYCFHCEQPFLWRSLKEYFVA